MKTNPYSKRRKPGVRGSVPRDFETINVFDRAGESVRIYVGSLDKGAYDSGYEIHLKDGSQLKRLPGVGQGWFESKDDATLYALYAVGIAFTKRMSAPAHEAILTKIKTMTTPTLDLL